MNNLIKNLKKTKKIKMIKDKSEKDMKYLVFSDIHGSLYYANKLKDIVENCKDCKVVLLGDLYYHGPRNNLPQEYNPKEVCNILNAMKDKILCCKGNCDAEVDEMISEFKFKKHINLKIFNKNFMFTHGHKYNKDNLPNNVDVLVYGHFHTGFIQQIGQILCINAGSLSLPKNNTKNSYLLIEDNTIFLKDLDNNIIDKFVF